MEKPTSKSSKSDSRGSNFITIPGLGDQYFGVHMYQSLQNIKI
jgi:hypothetical protein